MDKPSKPFKVKSDGTLDMRGRNRRLPREIRICPWCKIEFSMRVTYRQKFCSNKCRLASLHQRYRDAGGFFGNKTWTKDDDDLLRRLYPNPENSVEMIAQELGRTVRAVHHQTSFLGLYRDYKLASGCFVWTDAKREYYSLHRSGKNNPFYGRTHLPEVRKTISEKLKVSSAFHQLNKDPVFQKKRRKAWSVSMHKSGMNMLEQRLDVFLQHAVPDKYKFVGEGDVVIDGLNPDWIWEDGKKIIELFGRAFHDEKVCIWDLPERRTLAGRTKVFKEYGYDTLIVWDDWISPIDSILARKIVDFTNGLGADYSWPERIERTSQELYQEWLDVYSKPDYQPRYVWSRDNDGMLCYEENPLWKEVALS